MMIELKGGAARESQEKKFACIRNACRYAAINELHYKSKFEIWQSIDEKKPNLFSRSFHFSEKDKEVWLKNNFLQFIQGGH